MDLTAIFQKYVGAEVKHPRRLTCDVDEKMEEIRADARKNNLTLRVVMPGDMVSTDISDTRVNVYVTPDADQRTFVTEFRIG